MSLLAILALGLFLGMRHATDADHVVAVTTIVSRERSPWAALRVGALWGLGHTATIVAVGGAIILFGLVIPPRLGLSMEFSVAIMLIVLGAMNVTGAMRRIREVAHPHAHDEEVQVLQKNGTWTSLTPHGVDAPRSFFHRMKPLLVGFIHGLAGSAAVALLVLTTIKEASWAILYLAIFGGGTVLGMMLLTLAMSGPLAIASRLFGPVEHQLARVTGILSIAFGLFLAYEIGFVDGLFTDTPTWDPH